MSELIASLRDVEFADSSVAHVDLVRDPEPVPESEVFAAMVVVRDSQGRYAVSWSPRRQEWGIPGGWREPGESVVECAVREVQEETGLVVHGGDLVVAGYERFAPVSLHGRWPEGGGCMQLFRATVERLGEDDLMAALDDAVDPRWVSPEEFAGLSSERFWWPLVVDPSPPV